MCIPRERIRICSGAAVPSSHVSRARTRAWSSFNVLTYVTQRTHARGTFRGLTFSSAIQPEPTGLIRGPGHFLALLAAGVRVFPFPPPSLFLLLFFFLRRNSPPFLPKHASFTSFSLCQLRRENAEVVSAPVQVFIETHVYLPDQKLYRILTLLRYDVLGTPFCPSASVSRDII